MAKIRQCPYGRLTAQNEADQSKKFASESCAVASSPAARGGPVLFARGSRILDSAKRPLLLKLICLVTFLTSGPVLLRSLHMLPESHSMQLAYSQRPVLLPALAIVQSIILLMAAFKLWGMSRLAAKLFLAEVVIATTFAVYLTFISPSSYQVNLLQHSKVVVVFGLCFSFTLEIFRCWYAWWVTYRRPLSPS